MNLKGIYRNKSESTKLFLFVLIAFISSLIGGGLIEIASNTIRSLVFISHVFMFIIPPLLFSYFENDKYINELGFNYKFKT